MDLTVGQGRDPGPLVGVEPHDDLVEGRLDLAVPVLVRLLDDLVLQVAVDDLVGPAGVLGHGLVQPVEVLTELLGVADVEALLLGQVGGVQPAGDLVPVQEAEPLGVGLAVLQGDGDGLAVVGPLDLLDVVVLARRARPAAVAVPLLGAGRHLPGDLEVVGGDGRAVVPYRFRPEFELEGEGILFDQFRLFGQQVHVVLIGLPVGGPAPDRGQNPLQHLVGVDAAALGGYQVPGSGQRIDHPGDLTALAPFTAVAGIGVLLAVLPAADRTVAAIAAGTCGGRQRQGGQGRGESGHRF